MFTQTLCQFDLIAADRKTAGSTKLFQLPRRVKQYKKRLLSRDREWTRGEISITNTTLSFSNETVSPEPQLPSAAANTTSTADAVDLGIERRDKN